MAQPETLPILSLDNGVKTMATEAGGVPVATVSPSWIMAIRQEPNRKVQGC